VAPTEVIDVKPQACSWGQAECPDTRPYDTHQVIERPEIQMTVSLSSWGPSCPPARWRARRGCAGQLAGSTAMVSLAGPDAP
jgi:hypothetical protein